MQYRYKVCDSSCRCAVEIWESRLGGGGLHVLSYLGPDPLITPRSIYLYFVHIHSRHHRRLDEYGYFEMQNVATTSDERW